MTPSSEQQDRTRTAYDTLAPSYAALVRGLEPERGPERAALARFVDLVRPAGGPVADLGCGAGRLTAHLHDEGLRVLGLDLSAGMVRAARAEHPSLPFHVASLTRTALRDRAVSGVLAWYAVIHTPAQDLPQVFTEMARVLRPGGAALVAFQAGTGSRRISRAYGQDVDLSACLHDPDRVRQEMAAAGLVGVSSVVRAPQGRERHPQAVLLAVRDAEPAGSPPPGPEAGRGRPEG